MTLLGVAVLASALWTQGAAKEGELGSFGISDISQERIALNDYFNDVFTKMKAQETGQNPEFVPPNFYVPDETTTPQPFGSEDSWSILWYFASFSGLIVFFLVVSCSEWCCRKHIRRTNAATSASATATPSPLTGVVSEAPPPAYDLFAPPSYDSLTNPNRNKEKSEYDVYVVPVHAIGSVLGAAQGGSDVPEDAPPSYSAININFVPDDNERRQRNTIV